MSEKPDEAVTGEDVLSIAARGLAKPESLTLDEIQSLAGSALAQAPDQEDPPPEEQLPPGLTPEERAALEAELADITRKANKRRDMPGYAANVAQIDARIVVINALLAA